MQIKIPLFSMPFEVRSYSEEPLTTKEIAIAKGIEAHLDEETIQNVLKQMHAFYVEGVHHIESVLPQLIELGGMTQESYDELKKLNPPMIYSDDFINYLEEPFSVNFPEEKELNDGTFGLTMECVWDPEHGVGVWFENWQITRLGFGEAGLP